MNQSTIETALKRFVSEASGIKPSMVFMRDEPRPLLSYPAAFLLTTAFTPVGVDEINMAEIDGAPAGREIGVTIRGNREFTCSVTIETDSQKSDKTAKGIAELMRTRMAFPSLRTVLDDANLSLVRTWPTQDQSRSVDDHMLSTAVVDIRFGTRVTETDRAVGYIETAVAVGTITEGTEEFTVPVEFEVAEAPAP